MTIIDQFEHVTEVIKNENGKSGLGEPKKNLTITRLSSLELLRFLNNRSASV